MNKILTIIISLCIFTSICYCANSFMYLIYVKKLNQSIINTIMTKGNMKFECTDGQPCRKTIVLISQNTNYLLIMVTPKNQTQIDFLDDLESTEKILKLCRYNPPEKIIYNTSPWDLDIAWSVRVSTP